MPDNRILLGVIGRPHGVSGRVHVTSHTADPADLTAYGPLSSADGRLFTLRMTSEGIAEIREILDGTPVKIANRTNAEKLTNVELFIDRSRLPQPDEEEFYLADLVGLTAVDAAGAAPERGIVHLAVAPLPEVADVGDIQRPDAILHGPSREGLAERPREHVREQGQDGGAPGHAAAAPSAVTSTSAGGTTTMRPAFRSISGTQARVKGTISSAEPAISRLVPAP